ncbi:BspA family leucine-rich repeat surface protein [Winogradskyella sp. A3E31]|uniref:BspA family leucine-rich repeat surface protein n=1 Tax=Winogradskyella sp. A3E31 TaxID=3349637 RepID=UPI00398A9485
MYKTLLLSLLLFVNGALLAQNEFITTWEASNADLTITIPTNPANYVYNYTVDFGDGTILNNQTGNTTHTYATPDIYTVKISGDFPSINGFLLSLNNDNDDLKSVEQWGDIQWQSMAKAFKDCIFLEINASDTPDLSNVTDMSEMFLNAESVNHPLDNWDVSNVTDMTSMFNQANNFNGALNTWDVSNVTSMWLMFSNANAFNQLLNGWNVSNVTNMKGMFFGADAFNQPIDNWDVSSVTDMEDMFNRATTFNQPLDNWNVSNVTNMRSIFSLAFAFNQPLNNWDVSNVTNMREMFLEAVAFNQALNNWDVSNVTDMSLMFQSTNAFNQPLDNWDVSNVADMESMFRYTNSFNQPLNNWDVSNVFTMAYMFQNTEAFNQPLDNWDVSSVNFINRMFNNSVFNQDLSFWDFNVINYGQFIANSAMDIQNFDLLLDRFAQLNIENASLDADGLEFCNLLTLQYLQDELNWNFDNLDVVSDLGSDCNLNYIRGNVKFDDIGDGCDENDQDAHQLIVSIDNGQEIVSTLTNQNGNYTFNEVQGSYDVSLILHLPYYFSVSPPSQTVTFSGTNEIQDNIDFCITANQNIEDLSVNLFPVNAAIPGFESIYELVVSNKGTESVSNVEVVVGFDAAKQSFVSASQAPSSTTSNSIVFTLSNLPVFDSEVLYFTLLNVQPPGLNSGDKLTLTADVSPNTNDLTPQNNTAILEQTVVNSFDPNDKLVTQGDEISIDNIDEYLDYKIRFQNVGTANAINVKITDTISDKLDWTTFQRINSSHDYRLELKNEEEINFIFDNINLPYQSVDEEGSNGHVSFRIKPKPNVQVGDNIENKAYIFFDFNAPIITNTVSTAIVDNLGLDELTGSESVTLSPNPASHQVEIIHNSSINIHNVELYSVVGKLVKTYKNSTLLDISQLNSGLYLMKIETPNGSLIKKLIIVNQ